MELANLKRFKLKNKAKRVGRGYGSGAGGHTVGKGMKGQKSRVGHSLPFGFEGGQEPLFKKLPVIAGFRNPRRKHILAVAIRSFNKFDDGTLVTPDVLVESGLIKRVPQYGVKVVNTGKLNKKLKLKGFLYSESALTALEEAGCTLEA